MPASYAELHQLLEEKLAALRSQLEDINREVREDGVGYSNHMADAATEVFEQERDFGLARRLQQTYRDVQHALAKFEDGTYGICESCGTRIDLPRLEVMPEARYCMSCQVRLEQQR
ncbi:MAG TPA: hypothetical protein ENL34_00895 [Chloroflexi bacterium]|nr:hypothetical protein [Chloroflexota bacterium]